FPDNATVEKSALERDSDSLRRADISFVLDNLDFKTLAIGNGFGARIGQRTRIELNYFEILYKQGLPGLAFWFLLFAYLARLYRRTAAHLSALPLFLSGLLAFVATMAT